MNLHQLLIENGIDPDSTLVMRHRPTEPQLRKELIWLAAEKPDVFNAYQQCQNPRVERQLKQASHLASFIGHEPGRALFVGLYQNGTPMKVSRRWRQENAAFRELFAMGNKNGPGNWLLFDLKLSQILQRWQGKLVVKWPGRELSYSRWAHSNSRFDVEAIHDESLLTKGIPDWRTLNLTWAELERMPKSWKAALKEWRGIYYIFDTRSKKGYVGSVYGAENLLGRWAGYAKSDHGGNRRLRKLNPENFIFSILERVSPDTSPEEIIHRENEWKVRLHTREFGLNDN